METQARPDVLCGTVRGSVHAFSLAPHVQQRDLDLFQPNVNESDSLWADIRRVTPSSLERHTKSDILEIAERIHNLRVEDCSPNDHN